MPKIPSGSHRLTFNMCGRGWHKAAADKSVLGKPLSIGGKPFSRGVGTQAPSMIYVDLHGQALQFTAAVGVDDEVGADHGSVIFQVAGDDKIIFDSGVMRAGMAAREVNVDLRGTSRLILFANQSGAKDDLGHADWAHAHFIMNQGQPPGPRITTDPDQEGILTPPPPSEPRIHSPKVYGARPGNPFLYRIPVTGNRPMRFEAAGLAAGLTLDPATGIITGTTPPRGQYVLSLTATNASGRAQRDFTIVAGDQLALTPPMGWNSWYAYYEHVTDQLMRDAADSFISNGMADVGYQYVNLDDCWANGGIHKKPWAAGPARDPQENILPNQHFPDMKALTQYIHARGLKAGIYSSPGDMTCTLHTGSLHHEAGDAQHFAALGFDFLKYDLCSYRPKDDSLEEMQKPYRLMGDLLKTQKRDIVFNICQYGKNEIWKWGGAVGGHCWRTGGDLGFELDRIFEVALRNASVGKYSKPGNWNDPDYIQIGHIGNIFAPGMVPCPLTHNEQYSFMSLWCLMSAPLVYSGDVSHLDAFTTNVLCNPEVIAVDQDSLGQCARVVRLTDTTFVMIKNLDDGAQAVGLCNQGQLKTSVTLKWSDLGVTGPRSVRDLWRQKNLGIFTNEFHALVPSHGVVLVRIAGNPGVPGEPVRDANIPNP